MNFGDLSARAAAIRQQYGRWEQKTYGSEWTSEEIALGFVGDVGDLAKLVIAAEGKRNIPDARDKLAHELADCLWSVMVLAQAYDIDLEQAFVSTMDQLEQHLNDQGESS